MKTRNPLQRLPLALSLSLLASRAGAQVTLHVPGDFPTIQGAIDAASIGDTVLVAPGTYRENLRVFSRAVRIVSQEGPELTTIDGDNHGRVVDIRAPWPPNFVALDGFRITHGSDSGILLDVGISTPVIRNCIIESCMAGVGGYGGGMQVELGSPRVEGCTFRFNRAGTGGQGVTGTPGQDGGLFSPPTSGGQGGQGGQGGGGGAVLINHGAPLFVNCFFHDNQTGQGGRGGTGGRGGNGIILQNGANGGRGGQGGVSGKGGAVFASPLAEARFVNCTIVNNHIGSPGSGGAGGPGGTGGAGASNGSGGPGGPAGQMGSTGGIFALVGPTRVQNSILWGNDSSQALNVLVSHSSVQGGYSGTGNIDADPLLSGAALLPGSPCIDAGNDQLLPPGTTTDAEGYPRRFDHPLVPSQLTGSLADMGCNEFAAPFALPYGCGPAGSLTLFSGMPVPGSTLGFLIRDRDARSGARAALLVGTARTPLPCGTPLSGGGLLVDLTRPYSLLLADVVGPEIGVGPRIISLRLPPESTLIGSSLFVQGLTIEPPAVRLGGNPRSWSLLEAMHLVVGPALGAEPPRPLDIR